jgi:uncharacterized membrane protein HdeD (DUF308 family)
VLLGIALSTTPAMTPASFALVFGAFALIDGGLVLCMAISGDKLCMVWGSLFLKGVMGVAVGMSCLVWPATAAPIMADVIAVWAIGRGILQLLIGLQLHQEGRSEWMLWLSA